MQTGDLKLPKCGDDKMRPVLHLLQVLQTWASGIIERFIERRQQLGFILSVGLRLYLALLLPPVCPPSK